MFYQVFPQNFKLKDFLTECVNTSDPLGFRRPIRSVDHWLPFRLQRRVQAPTNPVLREKETLETDK